MHGLAENLQVQMTIEMVLPSKAEVEHIIETASGNFRRPIVVVCADDAHEPCRPEARTCKGPRSAGYWREAKGFRIYLVTKDRTAQIASCHQILDEQEFRQALDYAASLILQDRVRIGLLADGAPWIWAHLERAFSQGKRILDYFDLSENVHKLAESQHGAKSKQVPQWCEATIVRLWVGELGAVIWGCQGMQPLNSKVSEEIRKLIGYL